MTSYRLPSSGSSSRSAAVHCRLRLGMCIRYGPRRRVGKGTCRHDARSMRRTCNRSVSRRITSPPVIFDRMILVIDNYDSFTYNLVQYLGELGADVVVRRNDAISVDDVGALAPSAIVLSPGPCTPKEAGITVDVIRRWGSSIPILGVCLGHQAI